MSGAEHPLSREHHPASAEAEQGMAEAAPRAGPSPEGKKMRGKGGPAPSPASSATAQGTRPPPVFPTLTLQPYPVRKDI